MGGYADIIFLALISIILIFKLISILGQKNNEDLWPKFDFKNDQKQEAGQTVILNKVLTPKDQLRQLDLNYSEEVFLSNASEAFKIILEAYAQGSTHVLADLLDMEVMKKFVYPITQREEKKQICEINVLKVTSVSIEEVKIRGNIADISVGFDAEVIAALFDESRKIIAGHQNKIEKISYHWTFRRDMKSLDPSWKLVYVDEDLVFAKI